MERYSTEVNRLTGVFEEHISASVNQGGLDAHTDDSGFSFFSKPLLAKCGFDFFEKIAMDTFLLIVKTGIRPRT